MVYTKQIHVKVTSAEAKLLAAKAKRAGKSASALIRDFINRGGPLRRTSETPNRGEAKS